MWLFLVIVLNIVFFFFFATEINIMIIFYTEFFSPSISDYPL